MIANLGALAFAAVDETNALAILVFVAVVLSASMFIFI